MLNVGLLRFNHSVHFTYVFSPKDWQFSAQGRGAAVALGTDVLISRSLKDCEKPSNPHVLLIPFHPAGLQHHPELVLEIPVAVVSLLIGNVALDLVDL